MAITKLDGQLVREVDIDGQPYIVTLSSEGLKIVPKGKRKGTEIAWTDILSGQAALAAAMSASLKKKAD